MPIRKIPQTKGPKVEVHGKGVGSFTRADVERRAKEIAEIQNRLHITEEDRARARTELLDRDLPSAQNEDADTMQSMSRDPSDPVTDRGRQAPDYRSDDRLAFDRRAVPFSSQTPPQRPARQRGVTAAHSGS